jgi:hypothetical protein
MTRAEASKKVGLIYGNEGNWLLNSLEALGLIKFEDEAVVNAARRLAASADEHELHRALDARGYGAIHIIGALKACGYRAVPA